MLKSGLEHSPPDNLIEVWRYIEWLDRAAYRTSTNEALVPGPAAGTAMTLGHRNRSRANSSWRIDDVTAPLPMGIASAPSFIAQPPYLWRWPMRSPTAVSSAAIYCCSSQWAAVSPGPPPCCAGEIGAEAR